MHNVQVNGCNSALVKKIFVCTVNGWNNILYISFYNLYLFVLHNFENIYASPNLEKPVGTAVYHPYNTLINKKLKTKIIGRRKQ